PSERWFTATISSTQGVSTTIYYKVLTARLMMNGTVLTRLPRSYEVHQTYQRLVGKKVLDVVPSSMPSMIFEPCNAHC
ncbi:hypothetical protein BJ878DRAFT_428673, partial [Calycina marina]